MQNVATQTAPRRNPLDWVEKLSDEQLEEKVTLYLQMGSGKDSQGKDIGEFAAKVAQARLTAVLAEQRKRAGLS
jgi:hypothetical protein